ncbi:MAG: hypothetical protein ACREU5_02030 [Burkholderiales bacterium]
MSKVAIRLSSAGGGASPAGWHVLRPRACPCCVGRVQLQVELVRLLRAGRPEGIVVELPDAAHADNVARALSEAPLCDYVFLA